MRLRAAVPAPLLASLLVTFVARTAHAADGDGPADAPVESAANPPSAPSSPPAQQRPPAQQDVEVRIIGSRSDALQRVPGSGTVIGAKDLERAQPVDTAEMLRRVPGVQVRQDYGGGDRIDVSIRGLDGGRSRRVLMLEDGMPMAINPYSEPDMYFAPAIERYRGIEVVKGSGNILFGPQTLAGTINFLTVAPPERQTIVADLDVGTFGYLRGLARYGDRIGDARYVVQVLHRRGDGFRDLPFDSTDALAKVSLPTGANGEAMLKLGVHRDDAASDDVGLTSAMYRADPRHDALSRSSHLVLNRYDASLTHEQRFSASTRLKTLVYAYRTDRVWRRQDYTRAPAAGTDYVSIAGDPNVAGGAVYFENEDTVLDRSYDVLGLEPRFEHRTKTGAVEHTFDVGGRLLRESAHYEQRSGGYAETYAGSLDLVESHGGTAFAAYAQDRIAFRDDLIVTPGIRFEHLTFRRVIQRTPTSGGVADVYEEGTKDVNGVVPGIGMVYGRKERNAFAGFHVGYAPPRVTQSISPRGVSSSVGADKSLNYELGARTAPTRWSRVEATGFLSNFSNQVIVATDAGAGDATLTDAGATNLVGVESAALASLGRALSLPTTIDLGVRYTFARSTFRHGPNAGNLLPYAPQHSLNANLDVEHRSGLGGQVAYAFVGAQFADALNTRAENVTGIVGELDPRHIVDVTLHYRHKPSGVTLRLSAKNVFDATYVIARRPEGIFAGSPRQVLLGVHWEWERAEAK